MNEPVNPARLQPAQPVRALLGRLGVTGGVELEGAKPPPGAVPEEGGDKYRVGQSFAQGGMGSVLHAQDVNVRRHVAMKVMLEADRLRPDRVLRFIQEAQVTGQLEHPNIVPVHELGVDADGNVFYTMTYIRGVTLKAVLEDLRAGKPEVVQQFSLNRLLNIFLKVCDAVAYAHSKGVVHRDLKPENVMLGDYGEVLVVDWGLAKVFTTTEAGGFHPQDDAASAERRRAWIAAAPESEAEVEDLFRTREGKFLGTPAFMAPEQVYGRVEEIGPHSDIYGLGALLYFILTLHPPFEGRSVREVMFKVVQGDLVPPPRWNRGEDVKHSGNLPHCPGNRIPEALAAVAVKALAVVPGARYATVKELQAEIEKWQGGFATSAEHAGLFRLAWLLIKRHRGAATATGLAAAVLVVLSVGFMLSLRQQRDLAVAARDDAQRQRLEAVAARDDAERQRQRAEKALADFRGEQLRGREDRFKSAPLYLAKAHKAIEERDFDSAVLDLEVAVNYDPKQADARLLLAQIWITRREYQRAINQLELYRELRPHEQATPTSIRPGAEAELASGTGDTDNERPGIDLTPLESKYKIPPDASTADKLLLLCRYALDDQSYQMVRQFIPVFRERQSYTLAAELIRSLDALLAVYRDAIEDAWPDNGSRLRLGRGGRCVADFQKMELTDLTPLKGLPFEDLHLDENPQIKDLTPLRNMPLRKLTIRGCRGVSDLGPLKGLRLEALDCSGTAVSDLTPLIGMPLRELTIRHAKVTSLAVVREASLTHLDLYGSPVTDLSPIQGMPLEVLIFDAFWVKTMPNLRGLKSLRILDGFGSDSPTRTPDRFWQQWDSGEIAAQARLKAANPHYTGVGAMRLDANRRLIDVSLRWIDEVTDLTPLRGEPIRRLDLTGTGVKDLTPIQDLPLEWLCLSGTPVRDLGPLRRTKLTVLQMDELAEPPDDFSPLRGMPLRELSAVKGRIYDLSFIKGMPLEVLNLQGNPVADLRPLAGMKTLKSLNIYRTSVSSLEPLTDLTLKQLTFSPSAITKGLDAVRHMTSLTVLNQSGADDFWEQYRINKGSDGFKPPVESLDKSPGLRELE